MTKENSTLVLATGNEHKRRELAGILSGFTILVPGELGIAFEFDETGATYLENALGKAMTLQRALDRRGYTYPVIADDSGLSVEALDGAPGIHSARYGAESPGSRLTSPERNSLLLDAMKGVTDRRAFFVCCMALANGPYRFSAVQETWEGAIADTPSSATGGFGYDPVFLLPGRGITAADLSEAEKNALSHRAKAAQRILRLLAAD